MNEHQEAKLKEWRQQVENIYCLQGRELEIVSLLVQHRTIPEMARLLGTDERSITSARQSIMARLGLRRVRDLVALAKATQLGASPTPAEHLYRYVLPQLEGARVITPILRDRDWCGLLLRLADNRQVIAWLNDDEAGAAAGWVALDAVREGESATSPTWLRKVTAQKIEALVSLLDELDGDADFEPEEDDDDIDEPREVPVAFAVPGGQRSPKLALPDARNRLLERWRRERQATPSDRWPKAAANSASGRR
jgi:DNA-binding CsgD family transcriptional regulator